MSAEKFTAATGWRCIEKDGAVYWRTGLSETIFRLPLGRGQFKIIQNPVWMVSNNQVLDIAKIAEPERRQYALAIAEFGGRCWEDLFSESHLNAVGQPNW